MTIKFRVREAHGRFWPQFCRPEMDGGFWLGYKSPFAGSDINFLTLKEAKDYIAQYETKGETIHPYP